MFAGAKELFARRPPNALMAEFSPGIAERARKWSLLPPYVESLKMLRAAGYR